jgi:hypothetical protein
LRVLQTAPSLRVSDARTLFDIAYGIILSRYGKLIAGIRNNPKDVRFDDACKVAEELGFTGKGGKGSHNSFSRTGEREGLNFQKCKGGKIPPYQAKQLIKMIDKYHPDDPRNQDDSPSDERKDEEPK